MISGFYMALVLNEKYNQPGQYTMFLKQRFLRLYPTYFILLAAVVLIDLTVSGITGHAWGSLKVWDDNFHLLSPADHCLCLAFENLTRLRTGHAGHALLGSTRLTGAFHLFWHNDAVKPV